MGRASDDILIGPKPPPAAPPPPPPSGGGGGGGGGGGSSSTSSSSTGGSSGGGGGGGKSNDPYAYAKAQERKADREARDRYLEQAHTLQLQIAGIRDALGKHGFRERLATQLHNIRLAQRTADHDLMSGYRDRVGELRRASKDNEKAAADQGYANLANRSRERANALSEAQAQGAGESDQLRAQQMSLRSWNANQHELNRAYYDTRTSIASGLTDLTTDTRAARLTNVAESNSDREMVWNSYYDRRSETLTALGNTLGQQAEYYSLANEAVSSKGTKAHQRHAARASGQAFHQASMASGNAFEAPKAPKNLRNWEGHHGFDDDRLNDSQFSTAATELSQARPEGATLRKWTT